MAISAKSVDEVRSWLTGNGFADDTTEYARKFHGKWISTKVNCLSAFLAECLFLLSLEVPNNP